jgi:hypothetical protein
VDILRGADQMPETVIVATLRANSVGHNPIMIATDGKATDRMAIAGPDRLKWRELAHKSPECRDNQLCYSPCGLRHAESILPAARRIPADLGWRRLRAT